MRVRRSFALVSIVAFAVVVLAACAPSGQQGGGYGQQGGSSGQQGGGSGTTAVSVSMQNLSFVPAEIKVAKGGTVTFTNDDTTTHDVVGEGFDSGPMAAGETFSQKFETAGTFAIRCSIHPSMTGSVVVE